TDEALREAAARIQRKHCLAIVARAAGFASWEHARRLIGDDEPDARASEARPVETDFGTTLYPDRFAARLNHWFATYDEARAFREESGGYLLAYKRHFFVADRFFIEAIGLDPEDPDWNAIGRDWARPRSVEARRRLYGKLIGRPPES